MSDDHDCENLNCAVLSLREKFNRGIKANYAKGNQN
jgi:hypothetical protein